MAIRSPSGDQLAPVTSSPCRTACCTGAAPRQAGSQIAIRDDGAFVGSVSGGCVEGAVIESAQEVIQTGKVCALKFGVADETAWAVGLPCGGQIEIFVEPLTDG